MSEEEIWQQILDGQGYIVCQSHKPFPVGHVSHAMTRKDGRTVKTMSVVVAIADADEFLRQARRFDPGNDGIAKGPYFYRVIAE